MSKMDMAERKNRDHLLRKKAKGMNYEDLEDAILGDPKTRHLQDEMKSRGASQG